MSKEGPNPGIPVPGPNDFHITFTEPVEGTTFKAGDAMILRWVNQNLPTVDTPTAKIDIFESTFGTDPYLTNVEPDAELHYEALQYNVPMDIDSKKGSKYYLVLEAGPVRVSSATFFIEPSPETEAARAEAAKNAAPPTVTLTSPILAQQIAPGKTTVSVTWTATNIPAGCTAKVELWESIWGPDRSAGVLADKVDPGLGATTWTPPETFKAGTYYAIITISDGAGKKVVAYTGAKFAATLTTLIPMEPEEPAQPAATPETVPEQESAAAASVEAPKPALATSATAPVAASKHALGTSSTVTGAITATAAATSLATTGTAAAESDKIMATSTTAMSNIALDEDLPAHETKMFDVRTMKRLKTAYIPPSKAFPHDLRDFNGMWRRVKDAEDDKLLQEVGNTSSRAKNVVAAFLAPFMTIEVTKERILLNGRQSTGCFSCFAPRVPPINVPVSKGEALLVDFGKGRQLYFDTVFDPANNIHMYVANPNFQNHAALYYQMTDKNHFQMVVDVKIQTELITLNYERM